MRPYEPRAIRFHEVRRLEGWRLKVYSISHDGAPIDWERFSGGMRLAFGALPAEPLAPGRPGVGFVIAHQGRTADYLVLCWWDQENELPARVYVRPPGEASSWRPAGGSESICVWDLEIVWHERNAYVETLLAPASARAMAGDAAGAVQSYLSRSAGSDAGPVPRPGATPERG